MEMKIAGRTTKSKVGDVHDLSPYDYIDLHPDRFFISGAVLYCLSYKLISKARCDSIVRLAEANHYEYRVQAEHKLCDDNIWASQYILEIMIRVQAFYLEGNGEQVIHYIHGLGFPLPQYLIEAAHIRY